MPSPEEPNRRHTEQLPALAVPDARVAPLRSPILQERGYHRSDRGDLSRFLSDLFAGLPQTRIRATGGAYAETLPSVGTHSQVVSKGKRGETEAAYYIA